LQHTCTCGRSFPRKRESRIVCSEFAIWIPAFAGTSGRAERSIPAEQADQLALDAHTVGRQDLHLVSGIGRLERDRGAPAPEALEGGFLFIDQRDDDI